MPLAFCMFFGCGRTLTIHQDPYINTAPHASRPKDKQTGEPLELTVVTVYPEDLKKPENELLRPESRITARDWYARRPEPKLEKASGRFDIPASQIYLLTNSKDFVGRAIGAALRGAVNDGEKPITKSGAIGLRWDMVHNDQTVIYVFPKFIGRDGSVLPVLPAKFHPPGAYTADIAVHVGVRPDAPSLDEAQYIKVLSPRKLHGQEP